jgi:hypothetical protein
VIHVIPQLLNPIEKTAEPTQQEGEWATEPAWGFGEKKNSLLGFECRIIQPVA